MDLGNFHSRRLPSRTFRTNGFTLLELLVVIAIIAILASLLMGGILKARGRAERLVCLNNARQLNQGLYLFTADHEDRLPHNLGTAETLQTIDEGAYLNWVNNVMTWELDPENTNLTLIAAGGLGAYCGSSPLVYRCPSDRVLSEEQRNAGWEQRSRSLSMNAMLGDAGEFSRGGTNVNNPDYRQFFTLSSIPNPANIFVFIDEHPDSINDGYFLNRPNSHEWNDLPASYHDGAGNLTFADGHAETHQWRSASTKPPPRPEAANLPFSVPKGEGADFYWLMDRTSYRAYEHLQTAE